MSALNEACLRMNTFISSLSKCRHEAFILHSCLFFRLKSYAVHSRNSIRMYLLFLSDSLSLILSQRTDSKLRSLVIWSGQFTSKYFSLFIYNVRVIIVSVSSGSLRALWVSTYNMSRGVTDRVTRPSGCSLSSHQADAPATRVCGQLLAPCSSFPHTLANCTVSKGSVSQNSWPRHPFSLLPQCPIL